MLKSGCIHPEIMSALSLCGHGDKILIADGNYPLNAKSGDAKKVYLGLTDGIPTVTDVLKTLLTCINIEKAEVMLPGSGEPEIFGEFRTILNGMELEGIDRFGFYEACKEPVVRLAISTGEKRTFANILITVGVA
ncbi:MAG: RbsD/FucU family protein [Clostridium sp.]|uniref:RbsD/FucU family protein n=1 Tax=Clostridium sp. TaxID=1506 RepID=UPI0029104B30|nr:RbsD/FucU family protein [Clostridium sp.]MDU7336855.1 RbsD/FucU family protein [Clostridium sp.]